MRRRHRAVFAKAPTRSHLRQKTSVAQGVAGRCGGVEEGRRDEGRRKVCSKRTVMNEEDVFVLSHLHGEVSVDDEVANFFFEENWLV